MAVDYVCAKEIKAEQQIMEAEMKFMHRIAGYTHLDYKMNLRHNKGIKCTASTQIHIRLQK
jgi:hypothetical protein